MIAKILELEARLEKLERHERTSEISITSPPAARRPLSIEPREEE
jgi:hypothetical protein